MPPAELEEVLRNHPNIEDAAVVGIPHEAYGEVPRAFVVPKNGAILDERDVEAYVAAKVAKHKRLVGGVVSVKAIPKNPSGKILRRQLRASYDKSNLPLR